MFSGQSWVEEIEFWVFEVDLTVCIVILTSSLWLGRPSRGIQLKLQLLYASLSGKYAHPWAYFQLDVHN